MPVFVVQRTLAAVVLDVLGRDVVPGWSLRRALAFKATPQTSCEFDLEWRFEIR